MPAVLKDRVPVNYIWIGPPSSLAGSSGVSGHDVTSLITLWQRIASEKKHQVFFWCLDEFVPYYQDCLRECLIGENPIQICSIDAFLRECMDRPDPIDIFYEDEINHDAFLVDAFLKLFLNGDIGSTPIADRVSCKEVFSLFLLRSIGGFILDTNVGVSCQFAQDILPKPEPSIKFMLPANYLHREFKHWMCQTHARLPSSCFECWAMYSSGASEITKPMVRQFIHLAGYKVYGNCLIKASSLPRNVEAYLRKDELDKYQANLEGMSAWIIRELVQSVRGLPIMTTITTCIRRSNGKKASFFAVDSSAIKLIKIEKHVDLSYKLISLELGIIKTYNNTHIPVVEGDDETPYVMR